LGCITGGVPAFFLVHAWPAEGQKNPRGHSVIQGYLMEQVSQLILSKSGGRGAVALPAPGSAGPVTDCSAVSARILIS